MKEIKSSSTSDRPPGVRLGVLQRAEAMKGFDKFVSAEL